MFISIEDDIICNAIDENSEKRDSSLLTLRELLQAVRRKKHILFLPSITEGQINQLSKVLTKEKCGILKFIHSKRTDLNKLRSILSNTIHVSYLIPKDPIDNIIYINPSCRTILEIQEETHLIVENLLDAKFYAEIIGNYYMRYAKLPEKVKRIAYYPCQGGGSTISEVVKEEQTLSQHICLIIADSDKRYKNAEEGDTAGNIQKVIDECKKRDELYSSLQKLYVLSDVCEIENLIPLKVIQMISNNRQKEFINKYKDELAYYDMKLGLDYCILYDNAPYIYYKDIFGEESIWQNVESYKKAHKNKKGYEESVKDIPKLDGLWGTSLLRSLLHPPTKKAKMALNELKHISMNDLTEYQVKEWNQIGKIVYSWCCSFSGIG